MRETKSRSETQPNLPYTSKRRLYFQKHRCSLDLLSRHVRMKEKRRKTYIELFVHMLLEKVCFCNAPSMAMGKNLNNSKNIVMKQPIPSTSHLALLLKN